MNTAQMVAWLEAQGCVCRLQFVPRGNLDMWWFFVRLSLDDEAAEMKFSAFHIQRDKAVAMAFQYIRRALGYSSGEGEA